MAYSKFTTPHARYHAHFVTHQKNFLDLSQTFDIHYGPVDAVILEIRGSSILLSGNLEESIKKVLSGNLQPEDQIVIVYARKHKIPLYIVEPEINKGDYARMWGNLIPEFFGLPLLYPYTSLHENKKIPFWVRTAFGNFLFANQNSMGPGRNAVWARKLEEYIAPYLREKLGRKPRIGLNIGIGHMGIEKDLKYASRRNFTLRNWERFNFTRYQGMNRGENIGRIYEALPTENNWSIKKIETNLFDRRKHK